MNLAPSSSERSNGQRMLDSVSAQFRRLKRRVGEDIEKYANDPESNGFVIYYLTDQGGEPLKSTQTQAAGLALSDLEKQWVCGFEGDLRVVVCRIAPG